MTIAPTPAASPAAKRLEALRAVHAFEERLLADPRNAETQFQIGLLHLHDLENPTAAQGHLCRAVLQAPSNTQYRLVVREAWLLPTFEDKLELSLNPADRSLPWRELLAEVRELSNSAGVERAAAFEDGIVALRLIRSSTRANRRRVNVSVANLDQLLGTWMKEAPSGHVAATVSARNASRLNFLRERKTAPAGIWPAIGWEGRGVVHGRGLDAIAPILDVVERQLRGVSVVLHLGTPTRHVHMTGRFEGKAFKILSMSADPAEAVLQLPGR